MTPHARLPAHAEPTEGNGVSQCPLCQSHSRVLYRDLKDRVYEVPGSWTMHACTGPDCGLIHLAPMPTEEQNRLAYANYGIHSERTTTPIAPRRAPSKWVRKLTRWHRRLAADPREKDQFLMYLRSVKPGALLEIGCGDGSRAVALARLGWQVEALELDEPAAQLARTRHGLTVHIGGLEGSDLGTDRFDAIVMNHVIEHLMRPREGMQKILRALKPGGRFVCVTPNSESWGSRKYRQNWVGIDPPRHLHVFNSASLRRLLSLDFGSVDVFASTVNSGMHVYSSRRMCDVEPYRSGEEQGDPVALTRIRNLGIAARIRAAMGLGSGEELVGIAHKP
jgi:SAM-dependent methyltransferase